MSEDDTESPWFRAATRDLMSCLDGEDKSMNRMMEVFIFHEDEKRDTMLEQEAVRKQFDKRT